MLALTEQIYILLVSFRPKGMCFCWPGLGILSRLGRCELIMCRSFIISWIMIFSKHNIVIVDTKR